MENPPKFNHWHEAYEWHAAKTTHTLSQLSEQQLLKRVQNRQFDPYFSIWRVLGEKGSLKNCAPHFIKVLREEVGKNAMLQRYHCAGALFALMGEKAGTISELRKRVQWDHEGEAARQVAIDELEERIQNMPR